MKQKDTLQKNKCTWPKLYEKLSNICGYWENTHQNHTETPLHSSENSYHQKKKLAIKSTGEDMGETEPLYINGGDIIKINLEFSQKI